MTASRTRKQRLAPGRRLLAEPLVQFAMPALALFALYAGTGEPERRRIRIDPEVVSTLVENRALLLDRALDEHERRGLVDAFVEEEILVREAIARGLHLHDPRVRARLAAAMRFLLEGEPSPPSRADLDRLLEEEPERYRLPAWVSFEHVFFETPPTSNATVLAALRQGRPADELGDSFWLGSRIERMSERELASVLGDGFAARVMATAPGSWSGPHASARGQHWLRIVDRGKAEALPGEALEDALRQTWRERSDRQAFDAEFAPLRDRYVVESSP